MALKSKKDAISFIQEANKPKPEIKTEKPKPEKPQIKAFSLRMPVELYEEVSAMVDLLPKGEAGSANGYIVKAIERALKSDNQKLKKG